ncbi:unnamed protein product, partial [Ectocarpus fasciculatus]
LGERRPPPYAVISSQVDDPNGNAHAPDPAKPLVERIGGYRHTIASGKPSILFVVLAVICALVAVSLGHTQGYWVNQNEPPTGLADWSEVILKIQQVKGSDRILTAMDSGEEPLDVLMEVLMDDQKIRTETSEEAQQEAPPDAKAPTTRNEPVNKGPDRPQVPDIPATRSTGIQTSDSTTIPDDGSSRNNQPLGKTEEPTSSPSTGDTEVPSDLPDTPRGSKTAPTEEAAATTGTGQPNVVTEPKPRHADEQASGSTTTPNSGPSLTGPSLENTEEQPPPSS